MQRVVAWSINLVWSDDTEEVVLDVPQYVATQVDNWLSELEQERAWDIEDDSIASDDTYDEFGVNTKNTFNTPPKD